MVHKRHEVSLEMRTKMLDWMIEVLSSYKCKESTWFISAEVMDSYLMKEEKELSNKDVHLLGVTCMLIASKYEEVNPISITTFQAKIAHGKLSKDNIRAMEYSILYAL
jgi:hypothetical protein